MGTQWSAYTVIGFMLDDTCFDRFLRVRKEKSHVEKRFDQKTGKRLADVTIIDSPEMKVWVFDGKEYSADHDEGDQLTELCEAIAEKVKCHFASFHEYTDDEPVLTFHPSKGAYVSEENGSIPITRRGMMKLLSELERIGRALKALRVTNVGKPGIHAIKDGC